MVKIEDDVDPKMSGEGAESNGNVGFEEEIDGDPDCKIL